MLEYIRSNAQSFGVKLAFGVIILVFVFWGVGSLNEGDSANLVALVNGEAITARDFELSYRHAEESMQRSNPGIPRDQFKRELGHQVLRQLVGEALLRQEAARAGLSVTPVELRAAVGQIKAFQDGKGQFDPAAYKRVLDMQRTTPAQFESEMAGDLLRQKLSALLTAGAWVAPGEPRARYDFLREQRAVEYIFVPAARFMDDARPAAGEVEQWYADHKEAFAVPARADVSYVRVTPAALVRPGEVSEEDARAWYDANISRFTREEQVKCAHILVPLAEDAPEAEVTKAREAAAAILAELKGGKAFAQVADAHNGPNAAGPGGELGWIKRGMTVEPFEKAAFALKPGTVSEPVRSKFGLHIIRVSEKQAGGTQPFAEALDAARQGVALERGTDRLRDALDSLIEDNILGKPLEKSAQAMGLVVENSGLASARELQEKLGLKPEDAAALVATPAGAPMDRALEAGEAYVVARVLRSEPATTETLDAARGRIEERLRAEKALAKAMEAAAERRKTLQDGPLNPTLKTGQGIRTAPAMQRGGALADFAPDAALAQAVFGAGVGQWLPTAYAVSGGKDGAGAVLLHVASVQPPAEAEWEPVQSIMTNATRRERAEGLFDVFMRRLFSTAKVEVRNMDMVDRKGL